MRNSVKYYLFALFFMPCLMYSQVPFVLKNIQINKSVFRNGAEGVEFSGKIAFVDFADADSSGWVGLVEFWSKKYGCIYSSITGENKEISSSEIFYLDKKEKQFSGFIPFHLLNFSGGTIDLELRFFAYNPKAKRKIDLLQTPEETYFVPDIYAVKLLFNAGSVTKLEYDLPGKSIPLLNMFINDKARSGNGRPDLVWRIIIGNRVLFESEEATNDFLIPKGVAVFKVSEADTIHLSVFDNDQFTHDELIGDTIIPNFPTGDTSSYQGMKFQNVLDAGFKIIKQKIPTIEYASIKSQYSSHEGTSGINISINQQITTIAPVSVRPVFVNKEESVVVPPFVSLANGAFSASASGLIGIENTGKNELFVPHYSTTYSAYPAIEYFMDDYGILLKRVSDTASFSPKEIKDIKFSVQSEEKFNHNGINGIKITISAVVPESYWENISPGELLFSLQILNEEKEDMTEKIFLISNSKKFSFQRFQLLRSNHSLSFFLPFYNAEELRKLHINLLGFLSKNNLTVGYASEIIDFRTIELTEIAPFQINCKNHIKHIDNFYFRLYHGPKIIAVTDTLSLGKKIFHFNNISQKIFAEDIVRIELMGIDKWGQEEMINHWETTGAIFIDKKSIRLPSNDRKIRSGKLYF
jgi:hypothetical protein